MSSTTFNETEAFAEFGREMFDMFTERIADGCMGEGEEEAMEVAARYDLVRKEFYDPTKHGEVMEADPGDPIWTWVHLKRSLPKRPAEPKE